MEDERPLAAWLRGPWALPVALAFALAAWTAARLWAPVLGELSAAPFLVPVAALAVVVPVLHARVQGSARAAWVFAAVAGAHFAYFTVTLFQFQEGCPSGPVPWIVAYPFYVYMSATRVLPMLVLGVGGLVMLVPARTRWAGAWSVLVVATYVAVTSIVYYVGPGCGLPE